MNSNVKTHTSKNAVWTNAQNDQVPYKFVLPVDRQKESFADKIRKAALDAEQRLIALHKLMCECVTEVQAAVKREYELKNNKQKSTGKGNFTWYNFDGSIKVESKIDDIVKWDEELMREAYSLFKEFISAGLSESQAVIAGLVTKAFSNRKGTINTALIFEILSYRDQVKNAKYQKACELIEDAQRVDRTKLYMRVWERMEDGSYRNINLNFSSVSA